MENNIGDDSRFPVFDKDNSRDLDPTITLSNGKTLIVRRSKAIKYYKLTQYMAQLFSKDPSTKVGALFIYPGTLQILSMGYNGMPRCIDETIQARWDRPLKYKFVEHAERNAIYNAVQSGTGLKDSICIVSKLPCADCARGIIQSGCILIISLDFNDEDPELIARWKPDWDVSLIMFREAGIRIIFLTKQEVNDESGD
jgi:dCMP deaminase